VGYSRGGLIANELAYWLKEQGISVKFIGLYDPVDMTMDTGHNSEQIPSNVANVAEIIRKPHPVSGKRSRPSFNTIDGGPVDASKTTYCERRIVGTHSAMGGAPQQGDRINEAGFTTMQDTVAAKAADDFIRENAEGAGVKFGSPQPIPFTINPPYVPAPPQIRGPKRGP